MPSARRRLCAGGRGEGTPGRAGGFPGRPAGPAGPAGGSASGGSGAPIGGRAAPAGSGCDIVGSAYGGGVMSAGKVYLVGAGPGDPGLITVKGLETIKRADVLVYDRLASPRLLGYAPEEAERIYVGKRPDRHTLRQEEINELLVRKAKEGKVVVRLKGGDPCVFGRGGEEAETLAEHGIPFEVIPGITSAIAVPAYAGIPVTHRDFNASFVVVTGHERPEKTESSIDWEHLARAAETQI